MHSPLAPVGAFVVFRWESPDGPRHCSGRVLHRAGSAIRAAVLPGGRPPLGEVATVQSTGGVWTARLVDAGDGEVLVALPEWARSGNRRQAVRVPVALDAMWRVRGVPQWRSAQVLDLSVTGARVVTEVDTATRVAPGDRWELVTVDGPVLADVRAVSPYGLHPLLRVVGVRFERPAPDVARSIRERVSRTRGGISVVPDEEDGG